jgi:hypothetical protein
MRLLPFCIIFLLQISTSAQNLVPNPSFEDTLWCPYNVMQINAAKYWFAPDKGGGGGSSELYHPCNSTIYPPHGLLSVPNNWQGFQFARTGISYAGMDLSKGNDIDCYREHIAVGLINPLNPLRTYYIEFWTSLANAKGIAISNIGVHFSKDTVVCMPGSNCGLAYLDAHVEWQGAPITDTMNWIKVSGYYRANGDGVRFMTVGNFSDSGQTNLIVLKPNSPISYYYFDDFMVVDSASHANGVMEKENLEGVRVFPNPAEDELFLHFERRTENEMVFCLYDITGRLLLSQPLPAGQQEFYIDVNQLKSGLYVYRISGKNGSKCGKVLKR